MCAPDRSLSRGVSRTRPPAPRSQRGVSIIELMVGIVVAMLVGLAATSSAVVFTASQRQGMGVGGVAVNVTTALSALKNDAATAGLGFFGHSAFLCNTLNLSVGASAAWDGLNFAPVRITHVGNDDRIDIMQSTRVESGADVMLQVESDGNSAQLKSYLPAAVGDAVLLAPATPGTPCMVRSVTAVAAATADTPQILTFGGGGSHNAAAFTTAATFPELSGVTLLGQVRWNRYSLSGGNLQLDQPLTGASAVLARNVIALRAQYGTAAVGTTTLNNWDDATGADFGELDSDAIGRVRAVRVGVVTRSPQREKPNASGICEASSAKPQMFGVEITPDVTDWQCYRYRSAVVVIPLRNLVLGIKTP